MSSKYITKQQTFAFLSCKQIRKIWYKNIRAFLRYRNFRAGTFFRFTLHINANPSYRPTRVVREPHIVIFRRHQDQRNTPPVCSRECSGAGVTGCSLEVTAACVRSRQTSYTNMSDASPTRAAAAAAVAVAAAAAAAAATAATGELAAARLAFSPDSNRVKARRMAGL